MVIFWSLLLVLSTHAHAAAIPKPPAHATLMLMYGYDAALTMAATEADLTPGGYPLLKCYYLKTLMRYWDGLASA